MVTITNPNNFAMSPFALNTGLNLLYCGSAGTTAMAISNVNQIQENSTSHMINDYNYLLNQLEQIGANIQIPINLFLAQRYNEIKSNFQTIAIQQFYATISNLNFTNAAASRNVINQMIATQTNDTIENIVNGSIITSNTEMILINTISFSHTWAYQFSSINTTTSKFFIKGEFCNTAGGTSVPVQMMHLRVSAVRVCVFILYSFCIQ